MQSCNLSLNVGGWVCWQCKHFVIVWMHCTIVVTQQENGWSTSKQINKIFKRLHHQEVILYSKHFSLPSKVTLTTREPSISWRQVSITNDNNGWSQIPSNPGMLKWDCSRILYRNVFSIKAEVRSDSSLKADSFAFSFPGKSITWLTHD